MFVVLQGSHTGGCLGPHDALTAGMEGEGEDLKTELILIGNAQASTGIALNTDHSATMGPRQSLRPPFTRP